MENRRKSWKKFTETGRVSDYLEYRGSVHAGTSSVDTGTAGSAAEVNRHAADGGRPGGPRQEHG